MDISIKNYDGTQLFTSTIPEVPINGQLIRVPINSKMTLCSVTHVEWKYNDQGVYDCLEIKVSPMPEHAQTKLDAVK